MQPDKAIIRELINPDKNEQPRRKQLVNVSYTANNEKQVLINSYEEGKKIKWYHGIAALWALVKYKFID